MILDKKHYIEYSLKLDNKILSKDNFEDIKEEYPPLYSFLNDWYSNNPYLSVQTSGSTGTPKNILVAKERMINSAIITCSFLNLKENDTAFLCMPLEYIAGKMMAVRSMVWGLNLSFVKPSGNPFKNIEHSFDFVAMTPMQVYSTLQIEQEKELLKACKHIIIGGGAVDDTLAKQLKTFPNSVYSTYGMTETLSHIALRKINGEDASKYYTPFDSVNISLSQDNALIIDAPLVSKEVLYTNDVAEINSMGQFRIIGRKDNIINSGGVKVQIEEVEEKIAQCIKGNFAISSLPDPKFGEIVTLVVEENTRIDKIKINQILELYHRPKKIIIIKQIPMTETNKIKRGELKKLIKDI